MKKIFTVLAVVLLSGCAAKGPTFQQIEPGIPPISAGFGRLYFMNPVRQHARIAVDKSQIGECKFGAFFWEDLPAGPHTITLDSSNDFGAWDEAIEVPAGQELFIRIRPRKGQAIANGLFGPLGLLAEAAVATEGKSGTFQAEVLPPDEGKKVRSELVYFREGHSVEQHSSPPPVVAPAKTTVVEGTASQSSISKKPAEVSRSIGGCTVEQVLSMKSAALSDSQIRAACK